MGYSQPMGPQPYACPQMYTQMICTEAPKWQSPSITLCNDLMNHCRQPLSLLVRHALRRGASLHCVNKAAITQGGGLPLY